MPREFLFSVTKADLVFQTFKGSGPGGQHRNKVETAVRILHIPSGATGESQSEKSQHRNKRIAFRHLANNPKFRQWVRLKAFEIITKKSIEQVVDEQMDPENLKIEVRGQDGKWMELTEGEVLGD